MRLTPEQIEVVRVILRGHDERMALQWEMANARRISERELPHFLAAHRPVRSVGDLTGDGDPTAPLAA